MDNPKNPKERGLIKGAIRRVFSRSELRRKVLDSSVIKGYTDSSRKRVTRWAKCPECKEMTPAYLMEVDHKEPVVPLELTLEDMSWDYLVDRIWCAEENLQAVCKVCHKKKTKAEGKERRALKKRRKLNE